MRFSQQQQPSEQETSHLLEVGKATLNYQTARTDLIKQMHLCNIMRDPRKVDHRMRSLHRTWVRAVPCCPTHLPGLVRYVPELQGNFYEGSGHPLSIYLFILCELLCALDGLSSFLLPMLTRWTEAIELNVTLAENADFGTAESVGSGTGGELVVYIYEG
eukprot:1173112-Amphidinium_carterae.1